MLPVLQRLGDGYGFWFSLESVYECLRYTAKQKGAFFGTFLHPLLSPILQNFSVLKIVPSYVLRYAADSFQQLRVTFNCPNYPVL